MSSHPGPTEGVLFTDQYQLTMAQLYFERGLHERPAQFDYFFRRYPNYGRHQAGYAVFAGLDPLLDWMDEAQLDRVGCFQYENVAGARSGALPDHVAAEVKQDRWDRFMEKAQAISEAKLAAKVGRRMDVIVDEIDDEAVTSRTKADAPEIDGNVIINGAWDLEPGDFVEVKITGAGEHDLYADIGEA